MSARNPVVKKFALLVIATVATSFSAAAQGNNMHSGFGSSVHGVPPSVTSFGFGGRPGFHGVPPSVTSLNFGNSQGRFNHGIHQGPFFASHRHRNRGFISPFYGSVYAVPYAYPAYVDEAGVDDSMEEEDYRGGPTVFDRRGPGTEEYDGPEGRDQSYRNRAAQDRDEKDYRATVPSESAQEPSSSNRPRTVLVFKDGRQREVLNYAIVGSTLYDLSDGLTRKVALADLDLPSTMKENDDRGLDFQLPAGMKSN